MKSSLRFKIIATNLIVLILTFPLISIITVQRMETFNEKMLINNFITQARVAVIYINQSLLTGVNPLASEDEFNAKSKDFAFKISRDSGKRVLIFSKSKEQLADSEDTEAMTYMSDNDGRTNISSDFKELDEVLNKNQSSSTYVIDRNSTGERYIRFTFPVKVKGSIKGAVMLLQQLPSLDDNTLSILFTLLFAFLAGMCVIVIASILLSLKITKPIMQLKEVALQISMGIFTNKTYIDSNDEVGELARAFNTMINEIENRINIVNIERSKLNSILESMGEGVIALNKRGETIAVNNNARDIADDKVMADMQKVVKKVKLQKARAVMEINTGGKNLLVCATPLTLDDGEDGIVVMLNDVTELRLLQEKQKQFVTNVSHELKTPLTTILGYIDLLKEKGQDKEIFNKSVYYLQDAGQRLERLVSDLIDLSCLSKFEFEVEPKSTNISSLVKDIVEQMTLKAQKYNIKINTYIAETGEVLIDPARIKQVVVNVLDNAIKYAPEGEIDVILCDEEDSVRLSIVDNGCGIPDKVLDRIFEPFYRVDKARSRDLGGNGLGLAITKEIIERHNGTITIQSREGHGTKVSIILPKQ